MLSVRKLRRDFAGVQALREIDVDFTAGTVALLGRNGAGKSTLLNILAGLTAETAGEIRLGADTLGRDRRALRATTTLLPQNLTLDPDVSARVMVRHLLKLRGRPSTAMDGLLEEFGLASVADRPLRTFSGGMRQRVGLVYAFAAETPVLLLDEPTQGLDPWERLRFADRVTATAAKSLIVYSTHVISDVEAVAPRVLVLDQGRVVFDGSPAELTALAPPVFVAEGDDGFVEEIRRRATVTGVSRLEPGCCRIRFLDAAEPPGAAKEVEPTLTDAYLAMTRSAT